MVDEKKTEVASPKADKEGNFKVENISKRNLNLENGQIEAGKRGKATIAECSTLHKSLKVI